MNNQSLRIYFFTCAILIAFLLLTVVALPATPASAQNETVPVDLPAVALELVVDGLTSPVFLAAPADGTGRRFIVEQTGEVYILSAEGELLGEPFLNLSERLVALEGFDERGLLGFTFHPDYASNGRFFVSYSAPLDEDAPAHWNYTRRTSEFTVSDEDANRADPASERVLLSVDWPSRKHNGGALGFGPDGYLYIGLGDAGGAHGVGPEVEFDAFEMDRRANFWDTFAQDIDSLYGSILRIDVDSGYPGYAIPRTNPFVGKDGRDEIYAWGFRNPYRLSFDRAGTGAMFVSATAETLWESTYLVDQPGNYGWALKEGTHCFDRLTPYNPPADCPDYGPNGYRILDPIVEYPNMSIEREQAQVEGEGVGTANTGGYLYRGSAIPDLFGQFVFTDWSRAFQEPSGQIFVATPPNIYGNLWTTEKLHQLDARALSMGEDAEGELYVLTSRALGPSGDTGAVYKLVPAAAE